MATYPRCLIERLDPRFFKLRDDLLYLSPRCDMANAGALRVLETKTDQRIQYIGEKYGIPDGYIPPDDYLWLDISLHEFEKLSLGLRKRASYARALADRAPETEVPSLIQLGYVRARIVAYYDRLDKPMAATRIYRDHLGRSFVIVADMAGQYFGRDGRVHNAIAEGFTRVSRQFLLLSDNVNAAIAALDDRDPPEPLPRWEIEDSGGRRHKKGTVNQATTNPKLDSAPTLNDSLQISANEIHANRGGILEMAGSSFISENITAVDDLSTSEAAPEAQNSQGFDGNSSKTALSKNAWGATKNAWGGDESARGAPKSSGASPKKAPLKNQNHYRDLTGDSKKDSAQAPLSFSLYRESIDFEKLRQAEWCPETVVGLLSHILAIPAQSEVSPDAWRAECLEPAARLMEQTAGMAPSRAWERIDTVARYMATPGSPSWWQQPVTGGGRTTKSPVTPKNVADNFERQYADYDRHRHLWHPTDWTPYDGPPLTEYERGYGGIDPAPPVEDTAPTAVLGEQAELGEALPTTDEVPIVEIAPASQAMAQPLYAMSREEAADLADLIAAQYPMLSLGYREDYEDGSVALCVEHAEDAWITLRSHNDWYNPPPIVQRLIKAAIAFGESRAGEASEGNKEHDGGAETGAICEEMRTT